ncbi:hypothetical protein PPACK8108_LOCUS24084 [Phakopsora pachyrhizi]|uniref:NET domain-containing protein n=1 Tax=Phakopsora pachyrhizi TaxID=170000 RepID=A0AAV0BTW6_PHAPC|nr:hypothetical protein PPACK8108_LOCUS24084 [Phakopsora pachyrhizi]
MSLEMEFPKVLRSKRHMPTDLFKRLDSCQEIIDSISAKHPFEECLGTLNLDLVKIKIDLYHPTNTSHQNWQYSSVSADCRFVEFKGGSRNDLAEIRLMLEDVVKSVVDGKSQIEDDGGKFYWGAKEGKQARQIDKQNEVNKDKRTEEQRIQDKQDRGAENSEVRIKRTIRGEALVLRSHQ